MRSTLLMATSAICLLAPTLHSQQNRDLLQTQTGEIRVEHLARLDNPWGMDYLPDGRLLITEKPGRLRIFANGRLSEPIQGVPAVAYHGQGGLLDVTVDPDFARNGMIYLSYAEPAERQPNVTRDPGDPRFGNYNDTADAMLKGGAVASARLDGNQLRDVRVIWRQEPKTIGRGHFGNRVVFGADQTLFITSGERMRFDPAQDLASSLGKVVRINRDGTVPRDNPFAGRSGARGEVYSYGHRNMLGAAVHPATRQLWVVEMGPWGGDEVNIVQPGRNYGWPTVSNGDNYDGSPIPDHVTDSSFAQGAYSWNPAISPSGLLFYTGAMFERWRGNLVTGGLSSQSLFRLALDSNNVAMVERIPMGLRIRDVAQAPDGALMLLVDGSNGELLRLTPVSRAGR